MSSNQSLKVFVACGIGAAIGCLLMLQAGGNFLLTALGILAGGLVGYLAYQPRQVIRAFGQAFLVALRVTTWPLTFGRFVVRNFSRLAWANIFYLSLASSIVILTVLSSLFLGDPAKEVLDWRGALIILLVIPILSLITEGQEISMSRPADDSIALSKKMVIWTNPLTVFIGLPLIAVGLFLWRLPSILRFLIYFIRTFFLLIHSDIRLLCGIDAMIGAFIGYNLNNALIGFLVGGIVGLVNYELISKRWLKIAPQAR